MERLTKNFGKAYGLVKVRDNEQDVDSPYPNTLRAILESFQQLGAYENTGLSPAEIVTLQAENKQLSEQNEKNELWFNQNAGVLAAHNIGGFSFTEERK